MKKLEAITEVLGVIACSGFAGGLAHHYEGNRPCGENYILISKYASPDVAEFAIGASGIIAENGGTLCHLAVVARELGIPCLVAARDALSVLKDGEPIMLDARDEFNRQGKAYKVANP